MGKKDLWQSDYFEDKRRFADMINGTLFRGEELVKKEELEEVDSKLVYHDKNDETVSVIRDKAYQWKGQIVSIFVLENQSYVDYRMVFRVMLEEAVSYIKQQKKIFRKWKNQGYRFTDAEFLSQMRKEETYKPIVTLVLYLGKEKWDGAKSLYEMLEMNEELVPLVNNYKINLFDYHDYKNFSRFHTENRVIFELLSNSDNEKEIDKIIKEYLNDYNLDEEAVRAIIGMLDIKADMDKYKLETKKKEVKYNMCKAWDDHKESGRREGRQEGLNSLVNILSSIFSDFETIYNKIISDKNYENVTREQVMEYYLGK